MRIDGPSIGLPIIQFVSAGSGSVCGWVCGINVSLQTVLSWPFQRFLVLFSCSCKLAEREYFNKKSQNRIFWRWVGFLMIRGGSNL